MKTIILVSPNQYGYFTIYYNYSKFLGKEGQLIYICFDQGFERFGENESTKVIYVIPGNRKIVDMLKYYRAVINTYYSHKPAIILIKYYFFSSLLNFFIPRRNLLLDIRTGYISKQRLKTLFFNTVIRIESNLFKRVVTLSESLRDKLKLNIHKTAIVPLGAVHVETAYKTFNRITLLYIGTLTTRNIPKTVEGLAHFLKQQNGYDIDITYHIVGGGNQLDIQSLTDTIYLHNMDRVVYYHGQIYGERLHRFFSECNIGVSYIPMLRDYDCQPATKTVEYLMAGMPVIATATTENKRIITDLNGVLIGEEPEKFAEGLKAIVINRSNYNSSEIINSVRDYSYEHIIEDKLKPLLYSK